MTKISFGENPVRPCERSWACAMGFSGIDWLDDNRLILDHTPEVGNTYKLQIPGKFFALPGETITVHWFPSNIHINGVDDSNVSELEGLCFLTGSVHACETEEKTVVFRPEKITLPDDLLKLQSRLVAESDTLAESQRYEFTFGRFKYVSFSMQSDVVSDYLFLDDHLIMLNHSVFSDDYFWIGNGELSSEYEHLLFSDSRK